MSSPLSCVVSGRPVTLIPQLDANQWLLVVPSAATITNATVFLNGEAPFPPGLVGSVFYARHRQGMPMDPAELVFIAVLSNDNPSVNFRLSFGPSTEDFDAVIGIQLEGVTEAAARSENALLEQPTVMQENLLNVVGQKLYQDVATFLASHAATAGAIATVNPNMEVVPLNALQKWEAQIERRISFNRRFWDRVSAAAPGQM